MKLQCNVCIASPVVELPKPEEGKTIHCPSCDKQLAYGTLDNDNKPYWSVIDGSYDEDFRAIPVKIIEL